MPDKTLRIRRAGDRAANRRPVMLAIAGDSAAGKTTLTAGLVEALGPERCVSLCTDDYHRYDRDERRNLPFTALHPQCNHIDIMEQHLQLLACGQPVLKPVYDHSTGLLARPELVEPNDFIIVEGLFPLYGKLARACFDVTVFLDPQEATRRDWKIHRDTSKRGYSAEQVLAELAAREPESQAFIRPQRQHVDIVVRFAPVEGRDDSSIPLSAELMLRPTIRHPDLSEVLNPGMSRAMHLRLERDDDGRPVDILHIHGYVEPEESAAVVKAIWTSIGEPGSSSPECLGRIGADGRSEPLAITQLLLLHHLVDAGR